MKITTIQVADTTKKKISTFGNKGESYDTIIRRMYDMAVKTQVRDFLMSSDGTISLEEARKEVEKKWPRSK